MPLSEYIAWCEADAARDDGPAFAEAGPGGAAAEKQPMYLFNRQFLAENALLVRKLAAVSATDSPASSFACDCVRERRYRLVRYLTWSTGSMASCTTSRMRPMVGQQQACSSSWAGPAQAHHSTGTMRL